MLVLALVLSGGLVAFGRKDVRALGVVGIGLTLWAMSLASA